MRISNFYRDLERMDYVGLGYSPALEAFIYGNKTDDSMYRIPLATVQFLSPMALPSILSENREEYRGSLLTCVAWRANIDDSGYVQIEDVDIDEEDGD